MNANTLMTFSAPGCFCTVGVICEKEKYKLEGELQHLPWRDLVTHGHVTLDLVADVVNIDRDAMRLVPLLNINGRSASLALDLRVELPPASVQRCEAALIGFRQSVIEGGEQLQLHESVEIPGDVRHVVERRALTYCEAHGGKPFSPAISVSIVGREPVLFQGKCRKLPAKEQMTEVELSGAVDGFIYSTRVLFLSGIDGKARHALCFDEQKFLGQITALTAKITHKFRPALHLKARKVVRGNIVRYLLDEIKEIPTESLEREQSREQRDVTNFELASA
jgi:hypothetical protein